MSFLDTKSQMINLYNLYNFKSSAHRKKKFLGDEFMYFFKNWPPQSTIAKIT